MADPQHTVELLWDTLEPRKRGPKPSLSTRQIVDTAVALADAEGLEAASMHRVAKELGVTAMSIYRYVPSKDDLVELMSDTAVGHPPVLTSKAWRDRFLELGWAQKELYRSRPWLIDAPLSGPPMGPNNLLWMNAGLDTLVDSGLNEAMKLYAILTLSIFVRGEAQMGRSIALSEQRTGIPEARRDHVYFELLHRLADDDRFPAIGRLMRAGVFEMPDDENLGMNDADFEVGLQIVLDGVAALSARE
jgi:AcrR family transcriptional regulator